MMPSFDEFQAMLHICLSDILKLPISCLAVNDLWSHIHAYTHTHTHIHTHLYLARHTVTENLNFTKGSKTFAIVTSLVTVQSFILKIMCILNFLSLSKGKIRYLGCSSKIPVPVPLLEQAAPDIMVKNLT